MNVVKHPSAIKQALLYRELLDSGQADSQGDLSRRTGIPRTTITAYLRLLDLDPRIQVMLRRLDDTDPRLQRLTESRLRRLHGLDADDQLRRFHELLVVPRTDSKGKRVS